MPTFTLTANCEIIIHVDAATLEEAIDIAYETPVGYWEFVSDYPDFVEETGLPTMEDLERKEVEKDENEPNDPGKSGSESPLLS